MSVHSITIEGSNSVRLPTAGKYCDRDIVVTAKGTELPELTNPGTAEDLVQGKELIDADGNVVTGEYVPLDTSDATATAGDIVSGATAYVNGEKITGTIVKKYGGIQAEAEPQIGYLNGSKSVQFSYNPEKPSYISRNTGGVYLCSLFENFGDAEAADVAVGKTFTSAAGLLVEGTREDSGESRPTQEKTVEITENGTVEVTPDDGYTLSKVGVTVNVDSGVSVEGIPKGYAKCDYIQFSAEQTVDTGIVPNQDTKIRVVLTREKSTAHYLFGVSSEDNTAHCRVYLGGMWRFGDQSAGKNAAVTANDDFIYTIVVSKTQLAATNSKTTISSSDFTAIGSVTIGSCRASSGGLGSAQFLGKLFLWETWQGGELVQKLIPVTDGNGVYRFWDTVSQTFFDSITDVALGGGNF